MELFLIILAIVVLLSTMLLDSPQQQQQQPTRDLMADIDELRIDVAFLKRQVELLVMCGLGGGGSSNDAIRGGRPAAAAAAASNKAAEATAPAATESVKSNDKVDVVVKTVMHLLSSL